MNFVIPQIWDFDFATAKDIQLKLEGKIILDRLKRPIHFIAGADVAYSQKLNLSFAVVSIFNYPEMKLIEQQNATELVKFAYVPGYLTFREAPVLFKAFEKIKQVPDLILFDGQGIAHPRKMGIAAHLGILLNAPTIGCAKSRLVGKFVLPGNEKGSCTDLIFLNEKIGAVVRTRTNVKPVFVSPGFKITIQEAADWVLKTCTIYRIPEPIRQSHITVGQFRQKFEQKEK